MTEFYNCLIFLQFFTASFTIVLTPQGCARERIFSMKEQLYTIPLNDAVNAQDECPFCFIHRSIEQDLLDFVLGSGSSYMEADIREQTDKAGFCRYHFQKMFDYGNTLGNAWILKTHYQRMIREMQQEFASFRPDLIILDPPRDGIHPKALDKIIDFGVDRMVYISCKPTSLTRDLVVLQERGYKLEKACAVDMFPSTANCETIGLLTRVK